MFSLLYKWRQQPDDYIIKTKTCSLDDKHLCVPHENPYISLEWSDLLALNDHHPRQGEKWRDKCVCCCFFSYEYDLNVPSSLLSIYNYYLELDTYDTPTAQKEQNEMIFDCIVH